MPRLLLIVVSSVAALSIAAGCTSAGSSPIPVSAGSAAGPSGAASTGLTSASPSAAAPSAAPSAGAPASAAGSAAAPAAAGSASGPTPGAPSGPPSITAIDWGVIWDGLPAAFPNYPGARATVTGGGPASAVLDIPAQAPAASTWYQTALKAAGYSIVGANGPREDGSYDIVASRGNPDCQTEISLAPLGSTTTATIYLAAACPFS